MYKKIILNLIFLISVTGNAQSTVWVTVNDNSILPEFQNGRLVSVSPEFQELINDYNLLEVRQALPASKRENLQKVYEFKCDCFAEDLIKEIDSGSLPLENPTFGPEYELLYDPNDLNAVFTEDYALNLINAQDAWDITHGSSETTIAITDSNYDLDHEEIANKYSFYQHPNTHTNLNHGTAVAIIAAGNTDNNTGKSSIGFNCNLDLYRMDFNNLLEASYNGARVINISWSIGCTYISYLQEVVDEVHENGTVMVAAAGNGSTCGGSDNYVYPAAFTHVISVSSVGPWDNHERTIGDPNSTHQHNPKVDICAPGYDVPLSINGNSYMTGNGTSFAAPMVSGTIGLILTVNPHLTPNEIYEILTSTAVNIDSLNPEYAGLLGAGRLDAGAAVALANSIEQPELNTSGNTENPFELPTMESDAEDANNTFASIEFNEEQNFALFPNPTTGSVNLTWHSEAEVDITLYNSNGSQVMTFSKILENNLEINDLNAGLYFVVLSNSNGLLEKQKLIVQ